ncbi:MAG: amidase [Deltaproteobacteria bacterium]|nr:MAG: amidase [Deltaproteobacteria bacterium]
MLTASATTLAAEIRAGRLSPVDVVDAHIARIEQVDPLLNAMVARRFEQARAEALAARERLVGADPDDLPPFLGVPCTIKEFFRVAGMPRTAGLVARKGRVEQEDATAVARLRAAGFIVLGVSNVPEGGLWMETTNLVYGRTNNPWDLSRTPGGSSGGEAALIAAGASPVGLGSDIGGSIRIPAAMCGTIGHKPSGGLVPNSGQFPEHLDDTLQYLSTGPLCRTTRDLSALLEILAGPDGIDPHCRPMPLRDPATVDLHHLHVVTLEDIGLPVSGEMRLGLQRAAAALADRGATVQSARLDRMRRAMEIWSAMLAEASSHPYSEILGEGRRIHVLGELARHAFGRPRHSWEALLVTLGEVLTGFVPAVSRHFVEEGRALRQQLDELLAGDTVLLHPPYTRPAPRHRGAWTTPFHAGCTAIFNVMQSAVTVVPTGFDSRGLPVAVQVVGRQGADGLTIAAARAIEDALGGWQKAEPRPLRHSETWGPTQTRRILEGRELQ